MSDVSEVEEQRRKREAEWDAKTATGLIGLEDYSDYECDPEWQVASRGDQERTNGYGEVYG